jgi:hypothetical protein
MPMTLPTPLPAPSSTERYRRLCVDSLRQQALDRLYERRDVLENLIGALEDYQRTGGTRRAECVDISVFAQKYSKCSSDCVQSQI